MTFLSLEGNTGILLPVEVVGVFKSVFLGHLSKLVMDFNLMDVDGNESFNLLSDKWTWDVFETVSNKHVFHLFEIILQALKSSLNFFRWSFEGFLHLCVPDHLDSKESNLGLVHVDKFSERHLKVSACALTDCSDRALHLLLKNKEPVLDVSFCLNRVNEVDNLFSALKLLTDSGDFLSVELSGVDTVDGIKELLEIVLHIGNIRSL